MSLLQSLASDCIHSSFRCCGFNLLCLGRRAIGTRFKSILAILLHPICHHSCFHTERIMMMVSQHLHWMLWYWVVVAVAISHRRLEWHELLLGKWDMNGVVLRVFRNFTCVLEESSNISYYGHWQLFQNPYCPTDRYYDTVQFTFDNDNRIIRCRLTGHYSTTRRHSRVFAIGRLSHGVFRRRNKHVRFEAFRTIDSEDVLYDWDEAEDRRLFGY